MEKSVGEDPSLALRMTGSGWQGIPGRAGNDGDESWNDGGSKVNGGEGEHWKRWGEASWKDKGENSGKGEGRPDEGRRKMKEGWTRPDEG